MGSLGDAREHPRRLTLRGCLQLRSARASETTSPTITRDELGHLIKLNLQHRNNYQLGDAFLRRDSERRVAAIPATHHELALIVAVDQAHQITQHDSVLMAEAGARQDQRRETGVSDVDRDAGWNQRGRARFEHDVGVDASAQIQTR